MHLEFMTCLEICGNGAPIGMARGITIYAKTGSMIQRVRVPVRSEYCAAALGGAFTRGAERQIASSSPQSSAETLLDFARLAVLEQLWLPIDDHHAERIKDLAVHRLEERHS